MSVSGWIQVCRGERGVGVPQVVNELNLERWDTQKLAGFLKNLHIFFLFYVLQLCKKHWRWQYVPFRFLHVFVCRLEDDSQCVDTDECHTGDIARLYTM